MSKIYPKFEYNKLPESYLTPAKNAGRIENLPYVTECLEHPGTMENKNLRVYLPYGYDESKKYDILYLQHGAGDDETRWFGKDGEPNGAKHMIDHMIEDGIIEPLIVVMPMVDMGEANYSGTVFKYYLELERDIMPAAESKYSTYAETADAAGFKASRGHRAIGGFSLGAAVTWFAFLHELDRFEYFIPMCGDCWEHGIIGGGKMPEETADSLAAAVNANEFGKDGFRIYASVGTKDVAFQSLTRQTEAMRKRTDTFTFTETSFNDGNIHFAVLEDYLHEYEFTWEYLYNGLRYFFK